MSIGLTFLKRIMSRGRHRETDTQSTSGAANQPNSGPGGASASNPNTHTFYYTHTFYTHPAYYFTSENAGTCHLTGKWVPPGRAYLSKPNDLYPFHNSVHPEVREMTSATIVAGEILAYRAWYWDANTKKLRSIFIDYEWPPDEPAIGEPGVGFGLHGFKCQIAAKVEYYCIAKNLVFGEALFWGDVIEFEKGYTAEFGKVRNIYSVTGCEPVDEIRKVYRL